MQISTKAFRNSKQACLSWDSSVDDVQKKIIYFILQIWSEQVWEKAKAVKNLQFTAWKNTFVGKEENLQAT